MITIDRARRRLELSTTELRELVRLATGRDDVDTAPPTWIDAGIVVDGSIDPVAAAIALVTVAPDRSILVELAAGGVSRDMVIGWHRSGRATIAERTPRPATGEDTGVADRLSIDATHVELLPQLLLHTFGLDPGLPPASRDPIGTTAGVLDDALAALERDGRVTSIGASDDLAAVLEHGVRLVRAAGSWQASPCDDEVALLVAGAEGIWLVERTDDAPADRDTRIRLVPSDLATAAARLGDVVTGRRSPRQDVA